MLLLKFFIHFFILLVKIMWVHKIIKSTCGQISWYVITLHKECTLLHYDTEYLNEHNKTNQFPEKYINNVFYMANFIILNFLFL